MGVYVVTGGSKGIGAECVKLLRAQKHQVINIDVDGGDIHADLGTKEGRAKAIERVHALCPDGLDGLVSNAGIAGLPGFLPSYVLSVNFFGAVTLMEGLFELLRMKKGNCVVTVSGSIIYFKRGKYVVDNLLANCGDEERIGRLVDGLDRRLAGNTMYFSSKLGLIRWMRRSAPSWAARGVNLNAVAPGAVATTIMGDTKSLKPDEVLMALPMPTIYKEERMMDPIDLGHALAFMVSPGVKGISGALLYCDGGTETLLYPEKIY
jgi:NAD(P)-dependent dehydrogenase (short-subunit alcohol dehydrogenase family)